MSVKVNFAMFGQTNTYLSTLSSLTLRHLLLRATNLHPDLPIFDPNARQRIKNVPRPSPAPASLQPQASTNGSAGGLIQTEGSATTKNEPHIPPQLSTPQVSTSTTTTTLLSHPTTAPTMTSEATSKPVTTIPQHTSTHHSQPVPASPSSASSLSSDPYFDYDNPHHDPPYTYPRPGSGPIPLRPTTDPEDRMWLEGKEEDHAGVFSHLVRGPNGDLVPDGGQAGSEIKAAADVNHVPTAAAPGSTALDGIQRGEDVPDDAEGEPDLMQELEFGRNTEDADAARWL